jgi:hypothetical protein
VSIVFPRGCTVSHGLRLCLQAAAREAEYKARLSALEANREQMTALLAQEHAQLEDAKAALAFAHEEGRRQVSTLTIRERASTFRTLTTWLL